MGLPKEAAEAVVTWAADCGAGGGDVLQRLETAVEAGLTMLRPLVLLDIAAWLSKLLLLPHGVPFLLSGKQWGTELAGVTI